MGIDALADMERYFRRLDLAHNRVKATNDALGREVCGLTSCRGRGNVLELCGVEVYTFGHFDQEGTEGVLLVLHGMAELAWTMAREGYVVSV